MDWKAFGMQRLARNIWRKERSIQYNTSPVINEAPLVVVVVVVVVSW
jgi:hypothetical protein